MGLSMMGIRRLLSASRFHELSKDEERNSSVSSSSLEFVEVHIRRRR